MAERRGSSPRAVEKPAGKPRFTSGRECWVFRAAEPAQLCGHHPELIASALAAGEPLLYLLYSPIFDAKDGPFRVGGAPGSHAVGITPHRLLVSRDPHGGPLPRSVTGIDLAIVSSLQIGCALALGWFVIRFSGPQGSGTCPVLFGGQGMDHFRAVVRAYRGLGGELRVGGAPSLDWPDVWKGVPPYLRTELEPLIDQRERPLAVLRSPERWTTEIRLWRRRPVCSSAAGLLVATSRGLLWAASEPRIKPEGLSFGVNVTVVRPERVSDAAILTREGIGVLRLQAGDRPKPHTMEVLLDVEDVASAEEVVRLARAWRGRA